MSGRRAGIVCRTILDACRCVDCNCEEGDAISNPANPVADGKPVSALLTRSKRAAKVPLTMAAWIALCFGGAGRLDWVRGWICAAVYVVCMAVTGALVGRLNRGLLQARDQWKSHLVTRFDKVILSIYLPLTFLQVLLAGLDAVRYRWLPLPEWTTTPGILLFIAAMAMVTWTLVVNPFAEATVRIQTERGHVVVSRGPYRVVRHPMYVGTILMYPATALMLGSGWAMVVAGVLAALMIWRTAGEDGFLLRELPGYREFAACTRWRLLPGVW